MMNNDAFVVKLGYVYQISKYSCEIVVMFISFSFGNVVEHSFVSMTLLKGLKCLLALEFNLI